MAGQFMDLSRQPVCWPLAACASPVRNNSENDAGGMGGCWCYFLQLLGVDDGMNETEDESAEWLGHLLERTMPETHEGQ